MASQQAQKSNNNSKNLIFAVIIVGALAVFMLASRPSPPEQNWQNPVQNLKVEGVEERTYQSIQAKRNKPVLQSLSSLRLEIPDITAPVLQTEEDRTNALNWRAKRRAYEGTPPTIPHPITEYNKEVCLACHGAGLRFKGLVATVISHPKFTNCTQCHISVINPIATRSSKVGLIGTQETRPNKLEDKKILEKLEASIFGKLPPTIPHDTWMMQECNSCHGLNGVHGIRTPHPDRTNCAQCHVTTVNTGPWKSR